MESTDFFSILTGITPEQATRAAATNLWEECFVNSFAPSDAVGPGALKVMIGAFGIVDEAAQNAAVKKLLITVDTGKL